ncbi:MAG: RidA family protein [Melioribacteraceae bacterium]|nr:RidA family protein [Melioribacteraceae bacterium]
MTKYKSLTLIEKIFAQVYYICVEKFGITMIEEKLKEILGYELPEAAKPLAAYVPAQKAGNLIFTSGQLPTKEGKLVATGKVGKDVSEEDAIEAAKICAVNCLSAVKTLINDLDKIEQIVKLVVFVNSEAGFTSQPKIANGASEFIVNIFGEKGKHARSAVGVSELPLNAPVEVEMIVKVSE